MTKVNGGYLFTESALRDTVAGWQGDRESVKILRAGMDDLETEIKAQNEAMTAQIETLEKEISKERRESRLQLKRAKVNYFVIGAVVGAIIGAIAAND